MSDEEKTPKMEGGRYFRTGAYEKEKYIKSSSLFTNITIMEKCENFVKSI